MSSDFLNNYKTHVFDCDGVILDSNKIKTQAFYLSVESYGTVAADKLVDYHVNNGGISRYKKFEYFFLKILVREYSLDEMNVVLDNYAALVHSGLMKCDIAPNLLEMRSKYPDAKWLIVSGGDQKELNSIFSIREISSIFNGGIFGSPDAKDEIFGREIDNNNIIFPAVFIGDSKYDYESSNRAGIDFIFASYWTEFQGYRDYFSGKSVLIIKNMADLL
jgi:phosphoglycolate phosphatase-like HAD superfamily hydrolase